MVFNRSAALIEKVRTLYAAVGDTTDNLERFFTEDFVITEAADLPYGGRFEGRAALRALVDRINATIVAENVSIERFAAGDNHVIASLRFDVRLPDGAFVRQWVAEEFFFREELITEIRPYYFDNSIINRSVCAA
jgi:limonene-1,2-epoxide hydrolase